MYTGKYVSLKIAHNGSFFRRITTTLTLVCVYIVHFCVHYDMHDTHECMHAHACQACKQLLLLSRMNRDKGAPYHLPLWAEHCVCHALTPQGVTASSCHCHCTAAGHTTQRSTGMKGCCASNTHSQCVGCTISDPRNHSYVHTLKPYMH